MTSQPDSVASALAARIRAAIAEAGGWLPFDRFMALALYEPGLGYYTSARRKFGLMPDSGSDFVTAPELSPLFGRALAAQVAQALEVSGTRQVVEFGAGSGALAEQLLDALDARGLPVDYAIIDLSGSLQARQAERLARFAPRVQWLSRWPEAIQGVVVANELLDAIPVQLLHFDGQTWHERGVVAQGEALAFADRPTALRPPLDAPFVPGTVTEIHPQAEGFMRTLAQHLQRGAAFFIDYGFPEAEYYLPQRHGGTLMCHHLHQADPDPLQRVGEKDITAHVNFTGIALAAQDAGLAVVGYTSQARFLLNCGLAPMIEAADLRERAMAQKLITEHEMGELFKVLALASADLADWVPLGFTEGDRMHRL
ncbi:SAM-dependent methyltransferase [Ideonella sp. 4Y16]|uniref:SAM-dependent methyltransferase n=1 Tax=Ideonella alba TaxID=2824118 RepID=A0A941BKC7_9BURK|nr:SAM-dependent methyltransferase [Ideonella alba]MBQ0930004.1 SAM-dependent methyltransferase [Ideonella alba]MBQ0946064.1 SAM-dependent methyltransferase [Ideonella alba]